MSSTFGSMSSTFGSMSSTFGSMNSSLFVYILYYRFYMRHRKNGVPAQKVNFCASYFADFFAMKLVFSWKNRNFAVES